MYIYTSPIGELSIRPESEGWYIWVNDEKIEKFYPTAEEAADAVSFKQIGIVEWDLKNYASPPDLCKWRNLSSEDRKFTVQD
jgi:hypothetical protein